MPFCVYFKNEIREYIIVNTISIKNCDLINLFSIIRSPTVIPIKVHLIKNVYVKVLFNDK